MIKRLSEDSVQLCGRGKCCPIVTKLEDGDYEVADDYGNKIKIKKEEINLIADGVRTLDKSSQEQLICE